MSMTVTSRALPERGRAFPPCAERVRQLGGEKSSSQRDGREVIAERKGEIRVKSHPPRGGARKKHGAKMRADEQEPDRRPTAAGEEAVDDEAHIHQVHRW